MCVFAFQRIVTLQCSNGAGIVSKDLVVLHPSVGPSEHWMKSNHVDFEIKWFKKGGNRRVKPSQAVWKSHLLHNIYQSPIHYVLCCTSPSIINLITCFVCPFPAGVLRSIRKMRFQMRNWVSPNFWKTWVLLSVNTIVKIFKSMTNLRVKGT